MKQFITSIAIICISLQISAYNSFDQLCDFNPTWKKYENRVAKNIAKDITSDVEYIQMYLTEVLKILETNPTDQLSSYGYLLF